MLGKTESRILRNFNDGDALKDIIEKINISKGKIRKEGNILIRKE